MIDPIFTEYIFDEKSGLLLPASAKRTRPTAFDCFAGCGGFSLGFIQAGYEVVGALEWSCDAAWTYTYNLSQQPLKMHFTTGKDIEFNAYLEKNVFNKKNTGGPIVTKDLKPFVTNEKKIHVPGLPGGGWIASEAAIGNFYPPVRNFWLADIREVKGKDVLEGLGMKLGELDCMIGGPPCQGYSKANKKAAKLEWDGRNDLIFQYARLITEIQPKNFVLEEVPTVLDFYTPQGVPVIEQFIRILDQGGYMEFEAACNAFNYSPKGYKKVYRDTKASGKAKHSTKEKQPKTQPDAKAPAVAQGSLF